MLILIISRGRHSQIYTDTPLHHYIYILCVPTYKYIAQIYEAPFVLSCKCDVDELITSSFECCRLNLKLLIC